MRLLILSRLVKRLYEHQKSLLARCRLFIQNDNHGPPTLAQTEHYYSVLQQMFPNATRETQGVFIDSWARLSLTWKASHAVKASTYEAFFAELDKVRHTLPVITKEIGDTWADDPPSDPKLAAQFRALMRARNRCTREQPAACNASDFDGRFANFSRFLAKNIEHDWGTAGAEAGVWTNKQLERRLANCSRDPLSSQGCEADISWHDQRVWGTTFALDALRQPSEASESPHPLLEMAEQELAPLVPRQPSTVGLKRVPQHAWAEPVTVCDGAATVAFESAGAIALLRTAGSNRSCKPPRYRCHLGCILLKMPAISLSTGATPQHLLGETVVHVSSAAQRDAWAESYLATGPPVEGWIGRMFYKTDCPNGTGIGYRPAVTAMWVGAAGKGVTTVLFRQQLPERVVRDYGGAHTLLQRYTFSRRSSGDRALPSSAPRPLVVNITTWAFAKTRTRITESWWLRFHPALETAEAQRMRLHTLGSLIDPRNVVLNGSKTLHALDRGIVYGDDMEDPRSLRIGSLDVPTVKLGAGNASLDADAPPLEGLNPAPVPNDVDPRLENGVAFNVYNNLWETNAIQWYPFLQEDKDWTFRFSMVVPCG